MVITYTKHAQEKLVVGRANSKRIQKVTINRIIASSKKKVFLDNGLVRILGDLDKTHNLAIIIKIISLNEVKVITFFPARKGRYEN